MTVQITLRCVGFWKLGLHQLRYQCSGVFFVLSPKLLSLFQKKLWECFMECETSSDFSIAMWVSR